ncbi:S8 family serine peptidase [Aquicoccus sp. SU-CL01552]|uniref:S8 family serine peptidase n=1 Tax=Aquicoccus sp. SU-CL01552 TaxID=3127656 RepID=UPI00310C435A
MPDASAIATFTPTDPLYPHQRHLAALNGLETVWGEYTGSGVIVGVYDTSVDFHHQDLAGKQIPGLFPLFRGERYAIDPDPSQTHGTGVAGLTAASADGEGAVGVAFDASLVSVGLQEWWNTKKNPLAKALFETLQHVDVSNNSWGGLPRYAQGDPVTSSPLVAAAYQEAAVSGRYGLGTILVKAAGNESTTAQAEYYNTLREFILVGATSHSGVVLGYSNRGANLLVTAPVGMGVKTGTITTNNTHDVDWGDPYGLTNRLLPGIGDLVDDPTDYMFFDGTSAATPMISGVVALMLEANPDLGWRDVQEILSLSAQQTGRDMDSPRERFAWQTNGDTHWNGGGRHISNDYGYGEVDPLAAVRMAEVWSLFGDAATSANEEQVTNGPTPAVVHDVPGDGTALELATVIEAEDGFDIETVEVSVHIQADRIHDLQLTLVSPDGTEIALTDTERSFHTVGNIAKDGLSWTFLVQHLRGEDATGSWTLRAEDTVDNDKSVQLSRFSVIAHGTTPGRNDVYTFTDEGFDLLDSDPARGEITDPRGSADWLNLAAVSGDLAVNLSRSGGIGDGDSTLFSFGPGTRIEHAVSGDGSDWLGGNATDNILIGNRGDDRLSGRRGDDDLFGGEGDDVVRGGRGRDVIVGGEGDDTLWGGRGRDVFVFETGAGTDVIRDFDIEKDALEIAFLDGSPFLLDARDDGADLVIGFLDFEIRLTDLAGTSEYDLTWLS